MQMDCMRDLQFKMINHYVCCFIGAGVGNLNCKTPGSRCQVLKWRQPELTTMANVDVTGTSIRNVFFTV